MDALQPLIGILVRDRAWAGTSSSFDLHSAQAVQIKNYCGVVIIQPKGDVKLLKGGPVRRPSPPAGRGHLANVGLVAPCRFSRYSPGDCVSGDPRTLGLGSFGLQNPSGILCLEKLSRCLQQTTRS